MKNHGAQQTPSSIRLYEYLPELVTVLARNINSDKCCSLDTMRVNGNLPIRALDVSDTDKRGASDHANVVLKICLRPGLADKVFVGCTSIINTGTRLTLFARYDGNGRSLRARALLYYIIVEHIRNTLEDHGFSARVSSIRTTTHRFGMIGNGKRVFGDVLLTQLRT